MKDHSNLILAIGALIITVATIAIGGGPGWAAASLGFLAYLIVRVSDVRA